MKEFNNKTTNDFEAWDKADKEDIWVFDKLIVARKAGHICGPRGMDVPKPNFYMVKPVTNFKGMGLYARKVFIEKDTSALHPGEFWCEFFEGEHLSIDYRGFNPVLSVRGVKDRAQPFKRFTHWQTVEYSVPLPQMLARMCLRYMYVNCEFIGEKLIEVHLRGNPDFQYGNTQAIPVWAGDSLEPPEGFRFIPDSDKDEDERIGLFVN
jgi:hypothetical protein